MHQCPCCKQSRGTSQMQYVLGLMEQLGPKAFLDPDMSAQELLKHHGIGWTCDICIDNGVAELADKQKNHHSWYPYFSYYDTKKDCSWCGAEFTFSKEEKRFWFENLSFSFETVPVHCEACRKEFREGTPEQERCSVLLEKAPEGLSKREKEELTAIFRAWSQRNKLKY